MAGQDISFYKYLEAAFRYRLFNPKGTTATPDTRFNYLGYNLPFNRIFYYARKVLPKFYTSEFPDTEEGNLQMARKVLEKLDRRQDIELENQFKTVTASTGSDQIIAEAQAESQATKQQTPPTGTTTGVMGGMPGMPPTPSISSVSRRVFMVQQTPAPVGGKEGGLGQGTSATNKATMLETQRTGAASAKSEAPVTRSSGTPNPTAPVSPRLNPSAIRSSFSSGFKKVQNFAARSNPFLKTNLSRIANGLRGMAGGLGRGITGGIGGGLGAATPSLGRMGHGLANGLQRISAPGGIGGSGIGKGLSKSSNKLALGFIGMLLLIVLIGGLLGGISGTTPPGSSPAPVPITGTGCPDTSNNKNGFSCHYLNPSINIFDTNISQAVIDKYIQSYSSTFINAGKGDLEEFKRRVNYIIEKSKQGKLNPAIFLGYWKTESLFSTIGTRDLGCAGNDFYEEVQCTLAIEAFSDPAKNPIANCARSDSADSVACKSLKSIRSQYDKTHPINYPIRTFDDFAEAYGPYDDLTGGQPTNCINTYNKLIETAKELNACQAVPTPRGSPVPPGNFVFYCQKDLKWSGTSYACETIGYAGCGPTSLAMVLSSFGLNYDPVQTASLISKYAVCQGGTLMERILQDNGFLASIGLEAGRTLTNAGKLDLQRAKESINKGELIIGSSASFPSCGCGHIFVVQDVDLIAQTVLIRDPINCSNNGIENTGNRIYPANTPNWSWQYAYPVRCISDQCKNRSKPVQ